MGHFRERIGWQGLEDIKVVRKHLQAPRMIGSKSGPLWRVHFGWLDWDLSGPKKKSGSKYDLEPD